MYAHSLVFASEDLLRPQNVLYAQQRAITFLTYKLSAYADFVSCAMEACSVSMNAIATVVHFEKKRIQAAIRTIHGMMAGQARSPLE